jgi:hypothetical protein
LEVIDEEMFVEEAYMSPAQSPKGVVVVEGELP